MVVFSRRRIPLLLQMYFHTHYAHVVNKIKSLLLNYERYSSLALPTYFLEKKRLHWDHRLLDLFYIEVYVVNFHILNSLHNVPLILMSDFPIHQFLSCLFILFLIAMEENSEIGF